MVTPLALTPFKDQKMSSTKRMLDENAVKLSEATGKKYKVNISGSGKNYNLVIERPNSTVVDTVLSCSSAKEILQYISGYLEATGKPYTLYQIVSTVRTKEDGYEKAIQIPTFFLESSIQGIIDEQHAKDIAKTIINPNNDYIITLLDAIKLTVKS